ncbi:MAG: phosphonate dehydrogenase [Pseudomonadota bacterium]
MKAKIVVANWVHPAVLSFLGACGKVVPNHDSEPLSRISLIERCRDADALMAFMPESVDEDFLSACPKLRIVACALKGYDNFDVEACTRRDIWVTIVDDLLTAPTAELALGLMIALARNVEPGSAWVRSGKFQGWRPRFYGRSLDGSTVGLIGAGAVGKALAVRLAGFKCQLIYHDERHLTPDQERHLKLNRVSLEELRARSDFIVLALPLTQATNHLIDADFLAAMRPGSYLINPARGSLVNEEAVADALESGHLGGYAADTFEMEDWARGDRPYTISNRLLASEKTILTPHLGSAVDDVRLEIAMAAANSIVQCLRGERPQGAVNVVGEWGVPEERECP